MNRPLLITDCDEVLLHMVVPFRQWLAEAHDVDFSFAHHNFAHALTRRSDGGVLEMNEVWALFRGFFETEMHRQHPIEGALPTLMGLTDIADIVVLTNISEEDHGRRVHQLRSQGVPFPIHWNQGGKGVPVKRLIAEYQPSAVLFVDDLALHHSSVAEHTPEVWRLHMVGEPEMAKHVAPAPDAHARIDNWVDAEEWIRERLQGGPAPLVVNEGSHSGL